MPFSVPAHFLTFSSVIVVPFHLTVLFNFVEVEVVGLEGVEGVDGVEDVAFEEYFGAIKPRIYL